MSSESLGRAQVAESAPSPSTADHDAPAALHDSFRLYQAQAIHHFLHPSQTLPDEAAVERSPDFSSAEDSDAGDDAHSGATHGGASPPSNLHWRTGGWTSRSLRYPPSRRPSAMLGGTWESNAETQQRVYSHSGWMANASFGGDRIHMEMSKATGASFNDGRSHSTAERSHLEEEDGHRKAIVKGAASSPTALPTTQPDTALKHRADASPPLPSWPPTTAAAARGASPCRSHEGAGAASQVESPRAAEHLLDAPTPLPCGSTSVLGLQGTPALVVWQAGSSIVGDGGDNAPLALPENAPSAVKAAVLRPPVAINDDRRSAALQQRQRLAMGTTPALYSGYTHDGGDDGYEGGVHEETDADDSSDSEGEDVFDDNGGSTGCIFSVCMACCTFIYGLRRPCCSFQFVRCKGTGRAGFCCCQRWTSSLPAPREVTPTEAVRARGDGDDDSEEETDAESHLRRPLLSAAAMRGAAATPIGGSNLGSLSTAGQGAALPQHAHASSSLPPQPPFFRHMQRSRAAQSLRFTDEGDSDNDSVAGISETGNAVQTNRGGLPRRPPQQAPSPPMRMMPAPQQTFADAALAEANRDATRPPMTSQLRRFTKKLSRYSFYEVFAYFNVFSAADGANLREPASQTLQTATVVHARSPSASGSHTLSAQTIRASPAAGALHSVLARGCDSRTNAALPPAPPAASAVAASVCGGRRNELPSVSGAGQVFVLLHYLGFVLLTAAVSVLAVFEFRRKLVAEVNDETACNRFSYRDLFRPDFTFSLFCFFLNSVFATHYAVRAVRYERGGLLVVQVVIVLLQVGRAAYFLLFVADRYLRRFDSSPAPPDGALRDTVREDGAGGLSSASEPPFPADESSRLMPLFVFTWVSIVASVSLFVLASLAIPWVYASFGWRRYAQGIVSVRLARVRQRLTTLQTCVQLDSVITLNAYLATVFLLDTWHDQCELIFVTCAVLLVYALLVPALRRTRHWWPLLCGGCVLLAVSGNFAALIGDTFRRDNRLREMSSSPWYSACYTEQLPACLGGRPATHPISIYRDSPDGGQPRASLATPISLLPVECRAGLPLPAKPVVAPVGSPAEATVSAGRRMTSGAAFPSPNRWLSPEMVGRAHHRFELALDHVDNTSDTYISTFGLYRDYFRISGCNETCFCKEEEKTQHLLMRHIVRCCGYYGECRLKDAYRTYAVILLTLLMVLSYVVRVVLLAVAWRRSIEEDDAAIELFLQEKREHRRRRRRYGHRQLQLSGGRHQDIRKGTNIAERRQRPTELLQPKNQKAVASPNEVLVWNLSGYDAWRYESDEGRLQADLGVGRAPQQPAFLGAGATPLSR
ncbi:hypothetical protein ABL78_4396 [Leptomonas seymouri]|uniref:Transmembrane protein n=1 Tax=Leptomonas seymouri TaxID=5684 RepID=A0A0N1I4Y1_LEPSE|nr:hypothetical protein ABL78_4396 [Leptomonas seymouri]|eukprot:KPI86531.1 hypothetical protein ABL78_4396 [Leptomonas seymouri]